MCLNFPAETIHRRVVFAETVPKKLGCVVESMAQYFVATQLLINKPLVCNNERSGHKGVDLYKTKQPEVGRVDVDEGEVRKYGFISTSTKRSRSSRKLVRVDVDEVRKYIFLTFLLVHLNKIVPPLRLQPSTRHEMMQVNRVGGGGVAAPPPPPPPPLLRWSCLLLSSLFSSCCCSMTCSN